MSGDLSNWYLDASRVYVARVREELEARWRAMSVDLSKQEVNEVTGGLLARQCALAIGIAENTGLWNPNLGPLVLRAMADVHITLAWILLKPEERSRQYILHGLGQEKLLLEHLKSKGMDDDSTRAMEAWIDSQQFTWLTEVNVGSWSDLPIRDMADEAGLLDFYRLRYQPLSTAAHSMWNQVARANLRVCINPLHRYHRVPQVKAFPPDYHCWDAAASMLADTIALLDSTLAIAIDVPSAAAELDRGLEDYALKRKAESPPSDTDPPATTSEPQS